MTTQDQITTSKKVELSFTLPTINFGAIKSKVTVLLADIYRPVSNIASDKSARAARLGKINFSNLKNKFKFDKKNLKFILPVVIGVIVLGGIISVVRSLPNAESRPVDDAALASPDAVATLNLNREFNFPLLDESGEEAGTFQYVVESAALQKQIVVQGQRASAIEGRIFLILNLKLTNSEEQTIQLNTRDYLRLITASKPEEQFAPDIHNDPVEVQAVSTKYTRVGIAIDEEDARKLIQLKVGEIGGEKQTIDLKFNY